MKGLRKSLNKPKAKRVRKFRLYDVVSHRSYEVRSDEIRDWYPPLFGVVILILAKDVRRSSVPLWRHRLCISEAAFKRHAITDFVTRRYVYD